MSLPFLRFELLRLRRDPVLLFFIVVIPVAAYLGISVLLTTQAENVDVVRLRLSSMVGMAAYAAATAASTLAGQAGLERIHGWGRMLGMTPLGVRRFIATKATLAIIVATTSVSVIYLAGMNTGVGASLRLLISGLFLVVGSAGWALYGLAVGLTFKSESALAAASAGLVLFALIGNVFVPLSGGLLKLATFTPMYGYTHIARLLATPSGVGSRLDATTVIALVNWVAWSTALYVLAVISIRRRYTSR